MHLPVAGERRLLAVERERPAGDGAVLEGAAQQARGRDRAAVVGEGGSARVGELAHLGQLLPAEPLRDRGHEPGRDDGVAFAVSTSEPSTAAESTTGSVLGMARIAQ